MAQDLCHICRTAIPSNQSFFEQHGIKVCLNCFRTSPKCSKCGLPSKDLRSAFGAENICEFCVKTVSSRKSEKCFLCEKDIWPNMSRYEDHGKSVCQTCFKDAKRRCFFCGFPEVESSSLSETPCCRFCSDKLISTNGDISQFISPLKSFLSHFKISYPNFDSLIHVNWNLILGMQMEQDKIGNIKNFKELMQVCYPIYHLKGKIYILKQIPSQWLLPLLATQVSSAYYCQKFGLNHLKGETPFHTYLQGWCHYIGYFTAKTLKYAEVAKAFEKFPQNSRGDFLKFQAMSEFRSPKEMIEIAISTIVQFHKRYIKS